MRRFGLRYQLTGWFLLIGVVPAVVGSAYTYSVTRTGLFREAAALMRGDADAAVDRLNESLSVVQGELVLAADQVAQRVLESKPRPAVRSRSKSPPRFDFESTAGLVASWGAQAPVPLETWAVVDTQGEPRVVVVDGQPGAVGTLSDADRDRALAAQAVPHGTVVVGGVATSEQTARRVVALATPIIGADGAPIGSLHGEIPVESFRRSLEVRSTAGGSLWVFDETGRVVLTTDHRPDADEAGAALFANGRAAGDHAARVQIGPDSFAMVSLPLSVSGLREPWTVAVSVPEQTIAVKANPWRYVAVVAALAVVVVLFASVVSAKITRPIKTLEEGTRRIAQGDLEFQLQSRGHNELEQLAGSFQHMAYELKRARERVIKAERMAAIGEVSLAIHHELNNPLTAVMGFAEVLKAQPDLPAAVRDQVMPIYEGAIRMRDIIQKMEHVHDKTTEPVRGTRMTDLASIPASGNEAGGAA